jgi:uncharacterized Zn finger protein (UPF0148 family)
MHEGYCVKCKAKKPISEAVEEIMKDGRKAVKGKCPDCGVVMFKILGGKGTTQDALSGHPAPGTGTPAAGS